MGVILVIGDLNARVGEKQEKHVIDVTESLCPGEAPIDTLNTERGLLYRSSSDKFIKNNGRRVMSILNNCNLTLLNGRTVGDLSGNFTFHGNTGSSTKDL